MACIHNQQSSTGCAFALLFSAIYRFHHSVRTIARTLVLEAVCLPHATRVTLQFFFLEVEENTYKRQNTSKSFCSHVRCSWQLSYVPRNYNVVGTACKNKSWTFRDLYSVIYV